MGLYIHHRNLYNKGENEIGFVRRLIGFQPLMITWLFIKSLFPGLPNWIIIAAIPLAVVSKIVANWVLGYLWDKRQLFDAETTWSNERNKLAKSIQRSLMNGEEI